MSTKASELSLVQTAGLNATAAAAFDTPRLLADIGGTNARFALERAPGHIDAIRVLPCADYAQFGDAVEAYLHLIDDPVLHHAAIAIANPVQGDDIRMTNHHWGFSIAATRRRLQLETLLVVNDFTALAMALPHLEPSTLQQIGCGRAQPNAVMGLVGAGTGLGVGGLIADRGRWIALDSEGGHVSFSPSNPDEVAVLEYCWQTYPHVSAERLVSGPGLELIYQALAARAGAASARLTTPEIIERALVGHDALCQQVLDCFCAMLGTVASNVAVTLGTLGGLFIGGGVVPRLGDYFARSPFRERFESKGRFGEYLRQIPTFVITAPYPAFIGVAAILSEHLDEPHAQTANQRQTEPQRQAEPQRLSGLDQAIAAMQYVRDHLQSAVLSAASAAVAGARRIEFHDVDDGAPLAAEAREKFARLGLACTVSQDAQLQAQATASLGSGDVVVLLARSGQSASLSPSVEAALRAGATAIALAPAASPLAMRTPLTLVAAPDDAISAPLPALSTIAVMVLLEVLVESVARLRSINLAPTSAIDLPAALAAPASI